ncbi:MAG: HupE/UreJ family protein [Pseudolabrys sp.]
MHTIQLHTIQRLVFTAAGLLAATVSAFAHHPMGGKTPSTFIEGLLSGFGHPVIGPDHLAFIVAIGIAVGVGGLNLGLPVVFVAFSAVGVLLHVYAIGLPAVEVVVALSVLTIGLIIARGHKLPLGAWAALFALAGVFHGHAYGEAVFGAETTPIGAYLLGLVVMQSAVAVGVTLLARRLRTGIADRAPRLAGVAIAVIGVVVLAGQFFSGA